MSESLRTSRDGHQNPFFLESTEGKKHLLSASGATVSAAVAPGEVSHVLNEIDFTQIKLSCPVLVMVVLPVMSPKVWVHCRPER